MAKTKANPDVIHAAADACRALTERFVQPFLEATAALEAASDTLVAAAEAEHLRTRLTKEIAALRAELALDTASATTARETLRREHDTTVPDLATLYAQKHGELEATFLATQGTRQGVLTALHGKIDDAQGRLDGLVRQHAEALKTHRETLDAVTERATKQAQKTLAGQQALEREAKTLEEKIRSLRAEAQREATRLRELADRAG